MVYLQPTTLSGCHRGKKNTLSANCRSRAGPSKRSQTFPRCYYLHGFRGLTMYAGCIITYVKLRKGYVALATYGRVALIWRTNGVIECDVKCWCFNPYAMWALALQMEMGPHKDRGKLWPGWELNPRPSGLFTAAPPTELQGQTGAGRWKWRC